MYLLQGIQHWMKKWIYIKFAKHKLVANMVNTTFATIFTLMYKGKCLLVNICSLSNFYNTIQYNNILYLFIYYLFYQ